MWVLRVSGGVSCLPGEDFPRDVGPTVRLRAAGQIRPRVLFVAEWRRPPRVHLGMRFLLGAAQGEGLGQG